MLSGCSPFGNALSWRAWAGGACAESAYVRLPEMAGGGGGSEEKTGGTECFADGGAIMDVTAEKWTEAAVRLHGVVEEMGLQF